MIYKTFKRMYDFIFSLIGIVILVPLFIVTAIIIKIDSKGPVFFLQNRIGKNKKIFKIIKFRTMSLNTPKDTATHKLKKADIYITNFGKLLRKTSIDELPQLFNVLVGHMSLVGPRPALWNQFDLIKYRDEFHVHEIKPGITGYAQVNGRDVLSIKKKAIMDKKYLQKMNLILDIKILLKTFFILFKFVNIIEGSKDKNSSKEEKI